MDFKCRLCLIKTEPDSSINLFESGFVGRGNEIICDAVMSFAPEVKISPEDNFPQSVCKECLQKLNRCIEFRTLIITSDAKLKTQNIIMKLKEAVTSALSFDEPTQSEDSLIETVDTKEDLSKFEAGAIEFIDVQNIHLEKCKDEKLLSVKKKVKRDGCKEKKPVIKKHKCEECDLLFRYRYQYNAHKHKHTGDMPYRCDLCDKGFGLNYLLTNHRRIHFEERPFKCENCDKAFKFQSCLVLHRRIHKGIKPYKCDLCDKSFVQLGGLQVHRRRHTGEKPYVCEFCSKRFTGSDSLCKHLKIHQNGPSVLCPVCGKGYKNEYYMKLHMKQCHTNEKRYSCEICQKKFTAKPSLNVHMRIHSGVKPFECKVCTKSFTQSSVLKRHMRTHSGEAPYPCNVCEKRFAYSHHLLKHVQKEHPEISS